MTIVNNTNKELVLKLRFDDEKMLGINKKITNGLDTPPVRQSKAPSCKISITKKIKADLFDNCVFLYIKIKNRLLKIPKNITRLQRIKSKVKFKKKQTKLTDINCPMMPIHLKLIYVDFLKK